MVDQLTEAKDSIRGRSLLAAALTGPFQPLSQEKGQGSKCCHHCHHGGDSRNPTVHAGVTAVTTIWVSLPLSPLSRVSLSHARYLSFFQRKGIESIDRGDSGDIGFPSGIAAVPAVVTAVTAQSNTPRVGGPSWTRSLTPHGAPRRRLPPGACPKLPASAAGSE